MHRLLIVNVNSLPRRHNTDMPNVLGVSGETSSHECLEVHEQLQHSGDDHDDIHCVLVSGGSNE